MAHFLRERIAGKLCQCVPALESQMPKWSELTSTMPWSIRILSVAKQRKKGKDSFMYPPHLVLDYSYLQNMWAPHGLQLTQIQDWANTAVKQLQADPFLACVRATDRHIEFEVEHNIFMRECLHEILNQKHYGFHSKLHQYFKDDKGNLLLQKPQQTIVVDYSSPNIAKPFHAGHLRSTIMGNVIGNVFEQLGHRVVRINYLGNWGTQFGLLGVGYEKYGNKTALDSDPLKYLLEIYVRMNKEAKTDETVLEAAREFGCRLENGEHEAMALWKIFMKKSLDEYNKVYKRLGIKFDVFDGEAQQVKRARELIDFLKSRGMLQTKDGLGYVDLTEEEDKPLIAPLMRKDGTSLYITRDIVAAIERYDKYKFDKLLYFVEASQNLHFRRLFLMLQKLGHKWASGDYRDYHVRFGSIQGMSTRSGNIVLLKELLDTAQKTMLEDMQNTGTTKKISNEWETADILGKSGLIIQDLKQRRILDYKFSWKRMLSSKGDTGVALQYAHARLANIEKNCGVELDVNCDLESLVEPSAVNLVCHLARFDEALNETISTLDPHRLVIYLFMLARVSYVTIDELHVKGEPDQDKAKARLLLYHCSRLVLASGLQTLGIQPLNEF